MVSLGQVARNTIWSFRTSSGGTGGVHSLSALRRDRLLGAFVLGRLGVLFGP
jgi:hypothetical protein